MTLSRVDGILYIHGKVKHEANRYTVIHHISATVENGDVFMDTGDANDSTIPAASQSQPTERTFDPPKYYI